MDDFSVLFYISQILCYGVFTEVLKPVPQQMSSEWVVEPHSLYRLSRKTVLNMWLGIQDGCFPSERSLPTEARDHSVNSLQWLKPNRQTQQQPRWYTPTNTTDRHSACWSWPFSAKPKDSLDCQLLVPETGFIHRLGSLLCFQILSLFPSFPFWVFSSFAPSPFLVSRHYPWPQKLHIFQSYL